MYFTADNIKVLLSLSLLFMYCMSYGSDTLRIGNRNIIQNPGNKIMGDQDAAVCIVPLNSKLHSIELYFSSVNILNSDTMQLVVKSKPPWSCTGIGGVSNPIGNDTYTIGFSKFSQVDTGWNTFIFEPPMALISDTIYVWPNLIQQVYPRIVFAGFPYEDSISYLNGVYCGNGINPSDYLCEFTFLIGEECQAKSMVTDDTLPVITSDTICSTAIIGSGKNISYNSGHEVLLNLPFEVAINSVFEIDMSSCPLPE